MLSIPQFNILSVYCVQRTENRRKKQTFEELTTAQIQMNTRQNAKGEDENQRKCPRTILGEISRDHLAQTTHFIKKETETQSGR